MAQWNLFGYKLTENEFESTTPTGLKEELERYQKVLGKEFKVAELLKVLDIRSKLCIATACGQAPEWFFHELGQSDFEDNINNILEEIADSSSEIVEAINGLDLKD